MQARNRAPTGGGFWDFSLKIYASKRIASECIALQDQYGADVNVLLFCAYLGVRRIELTAKDIDAIVAATQPWQEMIVQSLRKACRAGKLFVTAPKFPKRKSAVKLRAQLKVLELEAECIEQNLLENWAADRLPSPGRKKRTSFSAKNIALYLKYLRVPDNLARARRLVASVS